MLIQNIGLFGIFTKYASLIRLAFVAENRFIINHVKIIRMMSFRGLCSNRKAIFSSLFLVAMLCGRESRGDIINPQLSHQLLTIQASTSVLSSYKISQDTTTLGDWLVFLNTKARVSDPYNLYKSIDFDRSLDNGVYGYALRDITKISDPVKNINLYDAYRYVNWIENGANINADTENGAYDLSKLSTAGLAQRKNTANYFIQSSSEWVVAAQYINTDSNYYEWTDTPNYFYEGLIQVCNGAHIMQQMFDEMTGAPLPIVPGVSGYMVYADTPYRGLGFGSGEITFRVASLNAATSIPEPSAISLLAVGLGIFLQRRLRNA